MNLHELLAESVSSDAITQLEEKIESTITQAVNEKQEELDDVTQELDSLTEKIKLYESYALDEMANKDAMYAERIEELKEKADAYGEFIYNDIVEKADAYTEKFVEDYKSKHPIVEKNETALDVLENIKCIFERYGMSTDSNKTISELTEKFNDANEKIRELSTKLYENDLDAQKQLVLDEMLIGMSLNEKEDIKSVANNIITESIDDFKRVVEIMTKRKNSDGKDIQNGNLREDIDTINSNNINENSKTSFSNVNRSNKSVTDIANSLK